jgi:hypothetical protein
MKKSLSTFLCLAVLAPAGLFASTSQLNLNSGSLTLNNSNTTTPLAIGDVLQFGYYTGATNSSTLFSGTWVPLTGFGGGNSAFTNIAIGYASTNGAGPGTFAFALTFTNGSSTSGVNLPSAGQIMSILFYNGTTLANSTYYGAASDVSWTWLAPASVPPVMAFSFDDTGIKWLDNSVNTNNSTAYTGTLLAVPEPSFIMLFALGTGLLVLVYGKRLKTA